MTVFTNSVITLHLLIFILNILIFYLLHTMYEIHLKHLNLIFGNYFFLKKIEDGFREAKYKICQKNIYSFRKNS